eukprot:67420-Amphidinium_carterae.1
MLGWLVHSWALAWFQFSGGQPDSIGSGFVRFMFSSWYCPATCGKGSGAASEGLQALSERGTPVQ